MEIAAKTLLESVSQMANAVTGSTDSKLVGKTASGRTSLKEYYYFWDVHGETQKGTSLHRLLASKLCTIDDLLAFLDHREAHVQSLKVQNSRMNDILQKSPTKFDTLPPPPCVRSQNCFGVTALHVAVYRNSIHVDKIIQLLIKSDMREKTNSNDSTVFSSFSLASIPMKCGSYPLHVLTGQNTTINETALKILVDIDPSVILKEDVNGDNPISLLWKNTLRFRWAISIMEGTLFIDYIDKVGASSWITIITPWKYIRCTLLMIRAALNKNENASVTLHELCSVPRCPPMLVLLTMSPEYNAELRVEGSVYSLDENGRLPLHHAVKNAHAHYKCVPDYLKRTYHRSLVSLLLDKFPDSVAVKDNLGRLPLHYALENGCMQEHDLMSLVELYPASLKIQDPVSGLYPFMLAAHSGRVKNTNQVSHHCLPSAGPQTSRRHIIEDMALQRKDSSDLDRYYMEWKRDHVPVSYLLLSLCPEALQYHQRGEPPKIDA
jgi:ankyrin repeat protein